MNPNLKKLKPYPFERLAQLKAGCNPPADLDHIALSIGEPQHEPPAFVIDALHANSAGLAAYPQARGLPELREAIANWLTRRFKLEEDQVSADAHVVPVSGTREGLFSFVQAVVDSETPLREGAEPPLVLMPNPFYQIYEGAAYLAGAEPVYLNTTAESGFLPDIDSVDVETWKRCRVLFICSPGNPTGATMDEAYFRRLIELSDEHDFIIASDECYSELYYDENRPPEGLLGVCAKMGRSNFRNCVVFHSLSKRSNVPGMRSGFVAGDADIMAGYLLYRTYHGCAMPIPSQLASVEAWNEDSHVAANRDLYRKKFDLARDILGTVTSIEIPPAAFYLWMETPIDEEEFVRRLYDEQNLTLLPGSYLSRDTAQGNPGKRRVRISLVPDLERCEEALHRIRRFMETL
ncbi:MAG: succinyldiaminopimelate transaminase [Gammaproteobacteria bacterium]|nr:succinyldiaminopimelate transaminase [Gammaproteobacteria bacterium]